MCNKQGHLKQDCLQNGQGGGVSSPSSLPVVRVICAPRDDDSECNSTEGQVDGDPKDDLMTKLRGMTLNERDEIIDSLISQENF